ncbi:MAG TPA: carboxypeptidase-like regulatory domain-containing protein, partial [Adhaeribacter sp.]|nr:carboxypeptidase-like regulatory domain-containing protein [Adhaeribacter sp.]
MKFFLFTLTLLLSFTLAALAQQGQLQGIVRDANTNAPLPFVSILVNQGPAGTTTNIDGKFQIRSQEPVHQLSFSYLGYQTLQFPLEKPETGLLTITLQPLATSLQEVVVRANAGPNPAHRIIELATAN